MSGRRRKVPPEHQQQQGVQEILENQQAAKSAAHQQSPVNHPKGKPNANKKKVATSSRKSTVTENQQGYKVYLIYFGLGKDRFLKFVLKHDDIRDIPVIPRMKDHDSPCKILCVKTKEFGPLGGGGRAPENLLCRSANV